MLDILCKSNDKTPKSPLQFHIVTLLNLERFPLGLNAYTLPFFFAFSQTLFHIINRKTGVAVNTKFYGDALVVFHHINAYEEDGHVLFDMITYKDNSLYDLFYIDYMKQDTQKFTKMSKAFSPPVCQRFVIPVNADLKVINIHNNMPVHFVRLTKTNLRLKCVLVLALQENPLGKNLVTLKDTTATAVFQKDGSLHCTPETLLHG